MRSPAYRRLAAAGLLLLLAGCATALDRAKSAHTAKAYEEAEAYYAEARDNDKLAKDAKVGLALMYAERAGDLEASAPEAAERDYRRALELDPVHDLALTGYVRLLRRQGRLPDASKLLREAAAKGDCETCDRLGIVVLIERGRAEADDELWDLAIVHYAMAQEIRATPDVALAIVHAHFSKGDLVEATAQLETASAALVPADTAWTESYGGMRASMLEAGLTAKNLEVADRLVVIGLPGEEPQLRAGLALKVADHLAKSDTRVALPRYEALLTPESALADPDKAATRTKVARIYANLGTEKLQAGAATEADAAFSKAIEADPDDWSVKLQRIVAISARTGARPALESLTQVPKSTLGLEHTRAILLSLRVRELVAAGDLLNARIQLDDAQKANPNLPEVHLAAATLLAKTPVEGLNRRERKAALGRKSLVDYNGQVFRYGEALAELQWIAADEAAGDKSLFRAPWLEPAVRDLEEQLKRVYPYEVEFRTEAEPVVVFHNTSSGFIEFSLRGPEGVRDELGVAANAKRTVNFPAAGLVQFSIGRNKHVFVAENYARITLTLP